MRNNCPVLLAAVVLAGCCAGEAHAQMFGARTLGGSTLSRRPAPGSAVGAVSGNERYLRGNRGRGSFVGLNAREGVGFVGLEQGSATGDVASATQGLRVQPTPLVSVNQPRAQRPPNAIYDPPLAIGFTVIRPDPRAIQERLASRLRGDSATSRFEGIVVSLEGGTATMRGTVASADDRAVAEAMVLFEPGVDAVRNELQVRPEVPQPNL